MISVAETRVDLTLDQRARRSGGDRYVGEVPGEDDIMKVYVPQSISRAKGNGPVEEMAIIYVTE